MTSTSYGWSYKKSERPTVDNPHGGKRTANDADLSSDDDDDTGGFHGSTKVPNAQVSMKNCVCCIDFQLRRTL